MSHDLRVLVSVSNFASDRASSTINCTTGLRVRFFNVKMPTGDFVRRSIGKFFERPNGASARREPGVLCKPLWARAAHIVQFGPVRIEQDLERPDRMGEVAEEPWRPATARQHCDHLAQPRHDGSPFDSSASGSRYPCEPMLRAPQLSPLKRKPQERWPGIRLR